MLNLPISNLRVFLEFYIKVNNLRFSCLFAAIIQEVIIEL